MWKYETHLLIGIGTNIIKSKVVVVAIRDQWMQLVLLAQLMHGIDGTANESFGATRRETIREQISQ